MKSLILIGTLSVLVLICVLGCSQERQPTADTTESSRFFQTIPFGDYLIAIAEGDKEPRSMGSYSIRVYGLNLEFPFDDYRDGKITRRDGSIKEILLADVTGDEAEELVVVIQSAGSGGYLSGDAFTVVDGKLRHVAIIMDVEPGNDILEAFRAIR
jgi:hypothetical protein